MRRGQQQSNKNARALSVGFLFVIGIILFYAAQYIQFNQSPKESLTESTVKDYPDDIFVPYQKLIESIYKNRKTTVFIDTRSQDEFLAKHIPQSINVSPESIKTIKTDNVTSFIIITSAGNEKGVGVEAYESLHKRTSADISILQGGFEAWEAFGGQIASFGNPSSVADQAKIIPIQPDELKKQLESGRRLFILDTRNAQAFSLGHIPGAKNIPLNDIEKRMDEIPSGVNIVAYGGNDVENSQTGILLSNLHFFATSILRDGFPGWQKNDFPIEK